MQVILSIQITVISDHFEILVKNCTKKTKICIFQTKITHLVTLKLKVIDFSVTIFSNFDLRKWGLMVFFKQFLIQFGKGH